MLYSIAWWNLRWGYVHLTIAFDKEANYTFVKGPIN